jgi:hypothetical protein
VISRVNPGTYSIKFRKAGLSVGTIDDITVKAGQIRDARRSLYLTVDEGSIVFIRGSVFTEEAAASRRAGRSVASRWRDSIHKLDSRITAKPVNSYFGSRRCGQIPSYLEADGTEPATKDVEVDNAACIAWL